MPEQVHHPHRERAGECELEQAHQPQRQRTRTRCNRRAEDDEHGIAGHHGVLCGSPPCANALAESKQQYSDGHYMAGTGLLALAVLDGVAAGPQRAPHIHGPNRLGTLTRAADNVWDSAGGLRYAGADRAGLNRVQHVLRHAEPDLTRATHSVFNVSRNKVLGLIDEAWGMRGNPLPTDPGAYIVPMSQTIGTAGENAVKIIVRPGTKEIITSYPVFVP